MNISVQTLQERIDGHKDNYNKLVSREIKAQAYTDFVTNILNSSDKFSDSGVTIFVIYGLTYFEFENTSIDVAIEEILGSLHRKFGFIWELNIEGNENDPVFVFDVKGEDYTAVKFRIKEGKFSQCKIVKKFIKVIPEKSEYQLLVECS